MPRTLLVSFSLLALVVTARPIAPISEPAEVQNAIKAIFEDRTKHVLGLTQGEVDIHLISDEGQQAVLSQLDRSAVKALVPLEGTESAMPPEVQRLREMLGGSKFLDDIEGVSSSELESGVEIPAPAVEEIEPSGLTSTTPRNEESARVLAELSFSSLLAVCSFASLAAVLYVFYLTRGLLPQSRCEEEKRPGDLESGDADEKSTAMQEKGLSLGTVPGTETSHPPTGVLVNIDEDVIIADGELRDVAEGDHNTTPESPPIVEKPWLIPLPPSPTSSPLLRSVQLDEGAPVEGNPQPAWAMLVSDEQRRSDSGTGNATPAIDLALAMQLRTGFGATADAAWLMRFVMALFGWIAVLVGGGERQATGRRLLAW